ncbi:MAG: ATP-binding protein [Acetobacteraceae bacterium]|nr:ATP-binding protein [Acetobacteraceae bacterium]
MESALAIEHPANIENLPRFMSFIDEACRRAGADEDTAYALRLAVEEVCINLIHYGYKDMAPGPIRVSFRQRGDRIVVTICDRARPFDPANAPAPDLTSDAEARPIGGLGWYLVKQSVDRLDYQTNPKRGNILTLTRRTRPARQNAEGETRGTVR